MRTVPRNLRYGLRRLNQNAGFTAVAVLCLALGICASITVFGIVNALVLRPIRGVADQDRLVALTTRAVPVAALGGELMSPAISYPLFRRYQEGSRAFSGLVAYQTVPVDLVIDGEPFRVDGQVVTDNYFAALGLRPERGRFFIPGDRSRAAQPEVVVSHALWRRALAGRQRLSAGVSLNGRFFAVVGVAPAGFSGIEHEDDVAIWMPIEAAPLFLELAEGAIEDPRAPWLFTFFGRLAPGVGLEQAQREMDLANSRLAAGLPAAERPPALKLHPGLKLRPGARGVLAGQLALLAGVVGLLMLVVCANLGGLLLVRAAARQEEIGVRLALGVTRGQLVGQLLAESVTLSLAGGFVGFMLSLWAVEALLPLSLGRFLPRMSDLSVDGRVVAFSLAVSLAAGILFGLLPALWSTRRQAVPLLRRTGESGGPDRGSGRLQETFVIFQVTVSLMLLVTTGLFVRTLLNLQSIDPGFDSANVLNLRLNLARREHSESSGARFYEQLLAQVRRLPAVRSATLVSWVPLSSDNGVERRMTLRARSGAGAGSDVVTIPFGVVVPGYFRSLGIPLLRGQDFSSADRQGSNPVVIVDEVLAKLLWPGKDPVGEQVELRLAREPELRQVIGVVKNVRLHSLQEQPSPYFYLPLAQHYEPSMTLQVRTSEDPSRVAGSVRSILAKTAPELGFRIRRFDDEVEEALAQPRLLSWLLGSFSLTALLVTAIGLYGTLAFTVSRRTRELGIRMALGARGFEIIAMVLRRGLALTLTGLLLGLAAASWVTSIFSGFLFGVTPTDPAVFAAVAVLLILVGLAASSLPAYSATRIDPMAIIRHE
jgi:predicted permease